MKDEKKILGMNKRTFITVALIVAAVLLIAALTVVLILAAGGTKKEESAPTTTVAVESDDYILFWNVEKELYAGKDASGMSSREPNPDTGYYQITFAMEGRQGIRRVKERKIVNKIDNMDLMALVLDDAGIVIDALPIEEVTGGYAVNKFYVESIDDNKVVVNSSNSMKGMQVELELTPNTKIYDVSGETGAIGVESGLYEMDCIMAIQNKKGEITHIYAVEREPQGPTATHYCDHCKQEVKWRAWMYDNTLPTMGSAHYYLYSDVELSGQMSIASNTEIVLNLNGKTVSCKTGGRMYSLHNEGAYLGLMDYEKGGKFALSGKLAAQGGCVWVRYGKFEMWSGTLDASKATNDYNGLGVCIENKAVFNMYGGTIIGGTAQTTYNKASNATSGGLGGSVMCFGEMNMTGGTIKNGKAKGVLRTKDNVFAGGNGGNVAVYSSGKVTIKGGTISGGSSSSGGGNIWMGGGCTVTIAGGTISGGETTQPGANGGNIQNGASTLNISGGTIKGGTTRNCAGNIYSSKNLNISGGTITGGRKLDKDGKETTSSNLNVFVVNGVTTISGGKIDGYFELVPYDPTNKCDVTISGNPVITGGTKNLYIPSGTLLKVGTLKSGANISVDANGVFTEKTAEANKNYFKHDKSISINYIGGSLCAGLAKESCMCGQSSHLPGCDKVVHAWMEWSDSTALPNSGYYYLTTNVTVSNRVFEGKEVSIALNGYTINGGTDRPLQLRQGTVMNLTGWGKSGSAVKGVKVGGDGGLVLLHTHFGSGKYPAGTKAPILNAYGVKFDASSVKECANGGAIAITSRKLEDNSYAGCSVTLYSCEVIGSSVSGSAGAVLVSGEKATFTANDTTIRDGSAKGAGGNLSVGGGAIVTLNRCRVDKGNSAKTGENLAIFGEKTSVTLNGTYIGLRNANDASGDNIYLENGSFVAKNDGDNITRMEMGMRIVNATSVKISGNVYFYQISFVDFNAAGKKADFSGLTKGTIGIYANAAATIGEKLPSGSAVVFESRNEAFAISVDGSNVKAVAK